jgi:hypothetical protein
MQNRNPSPQILCASSSFVSLGEIGILWLTYEESEQVLAQNQAEERTPDTYFLECNAFKHNRMGHVLLGVLYDTTH